MSRSRTLRTLEVPPGHIVRTVELIFKSAAKAVCIAGDFCSERFGHLPMRRDKTGIWRIRLILTPGRYNYQFIVSPKSCGPRLDDLNGNSCAVRLIEDWHG